MFSFLRLKNGVTPVVSAQLATATLAAAWVFGGATRFDVLAPIVPLVVALGVLAILAMIPGRPPLSRDEKIVWTLLFAIPIVQLIPLPMALWSNLPGHQYPRNLFTALGEAPWLPISLTPTRTISSGFGLVPAFAAYLAARQLPLELGNRLLKLLVIFVMTSVLLGFLQLAGGLNSPLRFYAVTNSDAAVGFFSNANHFGSFIAACTPIAAYLALQVKLRRGESLRNPITIAAAIVALLLLGAASSSSRAGIAFAGLAALLVTTMILARLHVAMRWKIAMGSGVAIVLIAAGVVILHWYGLRESDVEDVTTDGRLALIPAFIRMIAASLPLGTGLGSFDPVYRSFEDYRSLDFNYLNNAHNELAQIIVESGILGLAALIGWLLFIARRFRAATSSNEPSELRERAIVLGFAILTLLMHSLVDYPLRGASASATFAMLIGLLSIRDRGRGQAKIAL